MHVVVGTHGHCFDGLASAALFTRVHRELYGPGHTYSYRGFGYGVGNSRPDDSVLVGDENAILDYRLVPSERLTWYFDHHRTALQLPGSAETYAAGHAAGRMFIDPDYSSCCKLIRDLMRDRAPFEDAIMDELVGWADRIDAARFQEPEEAFNHDNPVTRLVRVVEHAGDDAFLRIVVPELLERPLLEVASREDIRHRYAPLGVRLDEFVTLMRDRCEHRGRVVYADLTDSVLDSAGKFVTYSLFRDSVYSVMVGKQGNGAKILVGYNPWSGQPRDADISSICARYGGGGHPYVGGIPFAMDDLARAREAALEIVSELEG